MEVRKFSREAVASVITSRLYAAPGRGNGFTDMHELCAFLLGGDCFDFAIAQHGDWLAGVLRAQYPDMPGDDVYDPALLNGFPAMLSVERPETKPDAGLASALQWIADVRKAAGSPPADVSLIVTPDSGTAS